MKTYKGVRFQNKFGEMDTASDNAVIVSDGEGRVTLLDPEASLSKRSHSPDGFSWGYNGSGSAQLALALLMDVVSSYRAEVLYQEFMEKVVSRWGNEWQMTESDISIWVRDTEKLNEKYSASRDKELRSVC